MSDHDLWGKWELRNDVNTPRRILQEQARLLEEKTNGVLKGAVRELEGFCEKKKHYLYVVAPNLNSYMVSLLGIEINPVMYPVRVFDVLENNRTVLCECEPEYVNTISRILGSQKVARVIEGLYAQSVETIDKADE